MMRLLPLTHIISGTLALITFWLPMNAKKGGKLHTRSGWAYIFAMVGVAITALLMGVWRLFFDPQATPASHTSQSSFCCLSNHDSCLLFHCYFGVASGFLNLKIAGISIRLICQHKGFFH